ncbi:MAG: sigma 54-interacting transcriptional regulator, partial [Nitrospinota bacterium]
GFTGVRSPRPGLFEIADGGTLLLDEVADISPAMQAKLVGVLENQESRRVGGAESRRVDVRIVAASNRSLEEDVRSGKLREDLFLRLNTVTIQVPPLRARVEDIPSLVDHFLRKYGHWRDERVGEVEPAALDAILRYPWPGNVRELEHAVERAVVLGEGALLRLSDLPPEVSGAVNGRKGRPVDGGTLCSLEEVTREHVWRVLEGTRWNKRRAASILGIDRSTLYRMLDRYGIETYRSRKA